MCFDLDYLFVNLKSVIGWFQAHDQMGFGILSVCWIFD